MKQQQQQQQPPGSHSLSRRHRAVQPVIEQLENRQLMHAVVDFRSATELGTALPGAQGPTVNGEPVEDDTAPPTEEAIAAAAASDPAGTVVYYRVE